jgi:hypothetical protein
MDDEELARLLQDQFDQATWFFFMIVYGPEMEFLDIN